MYRSGELFVRIQLVTGEDTVTLKAVLQCNKVRDKQPNSCNVGEHHNELHAFDLSLSHLNLSQG